MPYFLNKNDVRFPPVAEADPDGLLAIGGDLSVDRLLSAYRSGIFPWYDRDPILWWSPDPRFVLFPEELRISKSFQNFLRKNDSREDRFTWSVNRAFPDVIRACREINRPGQEGTWITRDMESSFCRLHEKGYAHSVEVWVGDELAGGLYGIRMGKMFFGESMFSRRSHASRFALIHYTRQLRQEGVLLIDCQVYTEYLESFGARMIDREEFITLLSQSILP